MKMFANGVVKFSSLQWFYKKLEINVVINWGKFLVWLTVLVVPETKTWNNYHVNNSDLLKKLIFTILKF